MAARQPTAREARHARTGVPVRVGTSSCLVGNRVRYDGGHARARSLTDTLAHHAELVTVCPELEMGLPTPRPSVRIFEEPASTDRLVDPKSGEDWTVCAEEHARSRVAALAEEPLDGFVLKKDSPYCGMERVKAWMGDGRSRGKKAVGFFARALLEAFPDLPVEEDGRLNDPLLRESFLERVWSRNCWRSLRASDPTPARLVQFHTAHKFLFSTHDDALYREAGCFVAGAGKRPLEATLDEYAALFWACLRRPAGHGRHVNALQHLLGHLGQALPGPERRQIGQAIEEYRAGTLPLMAPVSLPRFLFTQHGLDWPLAQV